MDEKSDQIVDHIENQKNQLGRNLDELESRVSETMDWRAQFNRHPTAMMGAALGGGLLLGALIKGATSSSSRSSGYRSPWGEASSSYSASSTPAIKRTTPGMSLQRQRASETFENIKGALIGYGISQLKGFLLGALPGFERHYNETAQRNSPSQTSQWQQGGAPYGTPGYGSSGSYGSPSSSGAGQQQSGPAHPSDPTHYHPSGGTL